jgi:benzil reductase ((S)-benzoin forming)
MSTPPGGPMARHVIITGISRGLGAAIFDLVERDGSRLFGIGRTFTESQRQAARCRPDRIVLHATDLASPDAMPPVLELERFLAGCGTDDEVVLVLNAAVIDPIGLVGGLHPDQLRRTVGVNLLAPMLLTNAVLAVTPEPALRVRILYISSAAAHRPYSGWAGYCATKAGAEMFLRCVAVGAARPCTVEVIDPGAMDTGMQRTIREHGCGLPGHERLLLRHQRGEIEDASVVAAQLVQTYLTPAVTA